MDQFGGKQFAERTAHRVIASDAKQLFHAGVPGLHSAFQIDGQYADVERFDDVFAEVLEASDFEGFLFQRGVQLGIVEGNGYVTGDGLHQLNVIARKEIAVHRFAKPQNGNGVLANAAGNKVIKIELLEGAANGLADVSGAAGRLEENRSTGKFLPRGCDEGEIQRLAKAHAHGTSQAHRAGILLIFNKNSQAVDEKRLRDAIHHGTQHGLEPDFIRQGAAEFDQRAAVVKAIAVEEAVQARLNTFAERLKEKRGDHDGDHAGDRAAALQREDLGDQGHECKVNGSDRRGSRGIGQAAFENDVHVHQAIADDGVTKTQGNQDQAERGELHPGLRSGVEGKGQDVQQRKRQAARQGAAGEPLQLLTKHAGARAAETEIKDHAGAQEAESQETQLKLIERHT